MARLTRSQQEVLNGEEYSTTSLMGNFIAALLGLFVPLRDAGNPTEQNYCDIAWVDWFSTVTDLLSNAFQGVVYKDSTDGELELSVTPFSVEFRGLVCTYAGGVNISGLSAETAGYVYADLSAAPSVTVAVGAAWPTVPHVKLAVITPPASGHWLNDNIVRWTNVQAVDPRGGRVCCIMKAFAYDTSSPMTIGTVPAKARILRRRQDIQTAFNGTAPTTTMGDAGNAARLMAATDSDPKTQAAYGGDMSPSYPYEAETAITLTITPDGSTAGAGEAFVEYILED